MGIGSASAYTQTTGAYRPYNI
uniref:Uncharacterized protein n=1 Tax=Anguilla anguilla TaxID=7936 RepID=A0A0E9UAS6_ANGAN